MTDDLGVQSVLRAVFDVDVAISGVGDEMRRDEIGRLDADARAR